MLVIIFVYIKSHFYPHALLATKLIILTPQFAPFLERFRYPPETRVHSISVCNMHIPPASWRCLVVINKW